MFKVDLHTHSIKSPDGGITSEQYKHALSTGVIDYVAVTDHNSISFAKELHESFGDKVVVGEEIMSNAGEIIGLFLEKKVQPNLTPMDTINKILEQDGLVYIPHPLESVRSGLQINVLDELANYIDIVEIANGRAFLQNKYSQVLVWTNLNNLVGAASSDAHGKSGLGHTFTLVSEIPTRQNLVSLLKAGTPSIERPSLRALLYPKYNRLMKRFS